MSTQESTTVQFLDPEVPIHTCHDCGVIEGQLHNYFPLCDMEVCPICGRQLLSCSHHLTPEVVVSTGRIPFIYFPTLCGKCGAIDPDFFHVPDREWRAIVPRGSWDLILCRRCYDHIAKLQSPRRIATRKRPDTDTATGSLF